MQQTVSILKPRRILNTSLDGSRENLKSSVVHVKTYPRSPIFIGIKNPDWSFGIHVSIEAVAIVVEEEWGFREKSSYNITSKQVAYLQD
jgi:hypothetical protein